jgi:hypothetical protein
LHKILGKNRIQSSKLPVLQYDWEIPMGFRKKFEKKTRENISKKSAEKNPQIP